MNSCRADELAARAKQLLLRAPPKKSASFVDRILNLSAVRPILARRTAVTLNHSVRREHYPAPYAILELWRRHGGAGAAGFEAEARSISELMCTPTSRNLVRVFLLQDRLKSLGAESTAEFKHVHVVGAGVMGGDIAAWSAYQGMTVTLQDRTEQLIQPALERAKSFFREALEGSGRGGRSDGASADGCERRRRCGCGPDHRGHRRERRGQTGAVCRSSNRN